MFSFTHLLKAGSRLANDNAPAILTAFGTVGTIGTAVLTAKATFAAAKSIADVEYTANINRPAGEERTVLSTTEKVKLVWPLYVMAVGTGTLTCGAIIMSHRVSSRRAAVLAAAYALNEGKLEEYQDKIKEKFGLKKEKEARDELAQEKVNADFESGALVFDPQSGKVMIKDEYSGRYFYSTIEDVNRAVNEINREVLNSMGSAATLSAFYDVIGLEHISISDYFGWNTNELCEIDWSTCVSPDGKTAVHVYEFVNPPVMNPDSNASFR